MKRLNLSDLVDDAAGEEGGRFLAVRVEVERHQGVGPHREVVVHGQNLKRTHSVCFTWAAVCVSGLMLIKENLKLEIKLTFGLRK